MRKIKMKIKASKEIILNIKESKFFKQKKYIMKER
jgi:hypothetical protein